MTVQGQREWDAILVCPIARSNRLFFKRNLGPESNCPFGPQVANLDSIKGQERGDTVFRCMYRESSSGATTNEMKHRDASCPQIHPRRLPIDFLLFPFHLAEDALSAHVYHWRGTTFVRDVCRTLICVLYLMFGKFLVTVAIRQMGFEIWINVNTKH